MGCEEKKQAMEDAAAAAAAALLALQYLLGQTPQNPQQIAVAANAYAILAQEASEKAQEYADCLNGPSGEGTG